MKHWISLIVSSLCEVGWVVSLRMTDGFSRLVPLIGYAAFGLGAAVFLSFSMKAIPMATAYAIWMGISVVGTLIVDVAFFKQPYNFFRVFCAILVIAATCGLRFGPSR